MPAGELWAIAKEAGIGAAAVGAGTAVWQWGRGRNKQLSENTEQVLLLRQDMVHMHEKFDIVLSLLQKDRHGKEDS